MHYKWVEVHKTSENVQKKKKNPKTVDVKVTMLNSRSRLVRSYFLNQIIEAQAGILINPST